MSSEAQHTHHTNSFLAATPINRSTTQLDPQEGGSLAHTSPLALTLFRPLVASAASASRDCEVEDEGKLEQQSNNSNDSNSITNLTMSSLKFVMNATRKSAGSAIAASVLGRSAAVPGVAAVAANPRPMEAARMSQQVPARSFGSGGGTRGARGHGWWVNYRAGKGGRHLQGEYHHLDLESLKKWNDAVFSLGSQFAYMDVVLESMLKRDNDASATSEDGDDDADNTAHRLVIELASEAFPKASDNFIKLLQAEEFGYKSSILHRIERNVGFVGGNVWNDTGRCADEHRMISSANCMEQTEKMVLSHVPGVITMLSQRVKEIDSRFIMCTNHAPHMDGMAVAIGRLNEESIETLKEWQSTLITRMGRPSTVNVRIVDCGLLDGADESPAAA